MENSKIEEVEKYKKMYKDGLKMELTGLVIGAIIGVILAVNMYKDGESLGMCAFLVYEITGIGLGWRTITNITNKLFANMTFIGTTKFWFVMLFIKLCLSAVLGIFMLPIFIIKTIIEYKKFMAQADSITKKEENN